jgi:hypothetical protein
MDEKELLKEIKGLSDQIKASELSARKLVLEDYNTIVDWWKSWPDWEPLAIDLLPENGTGGIMIEKNNKPIVAGFLYTTNSNICWMEWIISNPDYKEKDKSEAIELLISKLEQWAIDKGFKVILSIGRSKGLLKKHKKLGYHVEDKPSYEICKIIKK